ncbi:MAG: hypothetical protein AAF517_23550 [Planctomycetota bacterium]
MNAFTNLAQWISLRSALVVSAIAYYVMLAGSAVLTPYDAWLAVYAVCVVLSALPAGAFFREYAAKSSARSLFFHENNGFVLGYVVGMLSLVEWGIGFCAWAPVVSLVSVGLALAGHRWPVYLVSVVAAVASLSVGNPPGAIAFGVVILASLWAQSSESTPEVESTSKSSLGTWGRRALLAAAGCNAVLLQCFVVREFSGLLGASEISILLVAVSYFFGFSVGYLVSRSLSLNALRVLSVLAFFVHAAGLLFLKPLAAYFIDAGAGQAVLISLVVLAGLVTSGFYSMFLPRLIDELGARSLVSAYSWELSGAAAGGLLVVILATYAPGALWATYCGIFALLVMIVLGRRASFAFATAALVFLVPLVWKQEAIATAATEDYYECRNYRDPKLLFAKNSLYHSVEVIDTHREDETPSRRIAFINGVRYFEFEFDEKGKFSDETSLSEFTYYLAEAPARHVSRTLDRKIDVLIMGCGSMYTVARVLPYARSITLVEIDGAVVESARACWEDLHVVKDPEILNVVIDDVKHYLLKSKRSFDLIVNDISAPYYLGTALLHGSDFYRIVDSRLRDKGVFSDSTQGRIRRGSFHSSALKILRGVSDVFPSYRIIETYKKPRKRYSGYAYASRDFPFSNERLKEDLEPNQMDDGIRIHTERNGFALQRAVPFSLSNFESLFERNLYRIRGRMKDRKVSLTRSRSLGVLFETSAGWALGALLGAAVLFLWFRHRGGGAAA